MALSKLTHPQATVIVAIVRWAKLRATSPTSAVRRRKNFGGGEKRLWRIATAASRLKRRCSEDQVARAAVVDCRGVYLRRCYRSKDGKRHAYWALVKSVRTVKGPRQQVVAYLGDMDESGRLGIQQFAEAK